MKEEKEHTSSTGSSDDNVVSGLGVRLLDRLPDGHTGTKDGSGDGEVEAGREGGEVASEGDGVSAQRRESEQAGRCREGQRRSGTYCWKEPSLE
jgi:hypothetical protein